MKTNTFLVSFALVAGAYPTPAHADPLGLAVALFSATIAIIDSDLTGSKVDANAGAAVTAAGTHCDTIGQSTAEYDDRAAHARLYDLENACAAPVASAVAIDESWIDELLTKYEDRCYLNVMHGTKPLHADQAADKHLGVAHAVCKIINSKLESVGDETAPDFGANKGAEAVDLGGGEPGLDDAMADAFADFGPNFTLLQIRARDVTIPLTPGAIHGANISLSLCGEEVFALTVETEADGSYDVDAWPDAIDFHDDGGTLRLDEDFYMAFPFGSCDNPASTDGGGARVDDDESDETAALDLLVEVDASRRIAGADAVTSVPDIKMSRIGGEHNKAVGVLDFEMTQH